MSKWEHSIAKEWACPIAHVLGLFASLCNIRKKHSRLPEHLRPCCRDDL
jgi:hypothetical protein